MKIMTVGTFLSSYDRDILDLQDDPESYIMEMEAELEKAYPDSKAFNSRGEKVWPLNVLMHHTSITDEEPLWPEAISKSSCLSN